MSTQIEEDQLRPLKEGEIHRITPLGVTGQGIQQTSTWGALLNAGQPRTIDPRGSPMPVGGMILRGGTIRTREELKLAIIAEWVFETLK